MSGQDIEPDRFFIGVNLMRAERPKILSLHGFPGRSLTPGLLWFAERDGKLLPRKEQHFAWPVIVPRDIECVFSSHPHGEAEATVQFIGTYRTWPLCRGKDDMKNLFGEAKFVAIQALGELMPIGLVAIVEAGSLVLPADFAHIRFFVDFMSVGRKEPYARATHG
jgi:hypothetical protein